MKTTFLLLSAVLTVMSGFSLCGAEPRETVDYYFSFFSQYRKSDNLSLYPGEFALYNT